MPTHCRMSARVTATIRQLMPNMPRRTLEIGCGDQPFLSLAAFTVWLDWDQRTLRQLRTPAPRLCADGRNLPFCAACFDLILIRHPNLDHQREAWREVFQAVWRVLTADGILICTTYTLPEHEQVMVWCGGYLPLAMNQALLPPVPLSGADCYLSAFCQCIP